DTAERQTESRAYQRTQMTLVRSRLVLEAALRKPEVDRLPTIRGEVGALEWLEHDLEVDFPNGSEILVIGLKGDHPEDLAILVNAVADSYLQTVHELEHKTRIARLEKLKKLYETYQRELESKRKGLRDLAESAGANDRDTLAVKQQLGLEELSNIREERSKLRAELREAESEYEVLATRDRVEADRPVSAATLDWYIEQDPQVRDLRASMGELEFKLTEAKRVTRSQSDASIRALGSRRDSMKKNLDARIKAVRPSIEADLKDKDRAVQTSDLAQAKTRMEVLELYDARLVQEIERLSGEGKTLSRNVLDLNQSSDEVKIIDDVARKVGAEAEGLEVELQAAPRILPLHRAAVPRTKDELKRLKVVAGAAGVTFLATLAGIAVWEFRARRISSLEVVVNGMGLRLVGTLPLVPKARNKQLTASPDRRLSLLVESVDAARTVLLHAARTGGLRVVMITSAVKGEGKTSLSVYLAMSLARAGRRTVLVDCDFRGSAIHRLFDVGDAPGVCDLIRGEASLDEAIVSTHVPTLWVIQAGMSDAATFQEIACDGLRGIFHELKSRFDFVIVDSAPILPVVDSLLVGQQVDAVLFSIFRDVSRVPDVMAAYQRVETLGIRTLGAVVAGATDDPTASSHKAPYANSFGA
ncbi:polysaccharide biosynthesis tyrosine autokinase, partial [Singulisphaera rosea]